MIILKTVNTNQTTKTMDYATHRYINNQVKRVQDSAKDSEYPANIVLSHEGTKTKTLNVNANQLEQIRKILLTPDNTLIN